MEMAEMSVAAKYHHHTYSVPGPSTSGTEGGGGGASVWHTGQNTTVVVNQPAAVVRPGPIEQVHAPYPIPTVCFNCQERVVTYIYYQTGCCTWAACIGLMMAG